jgi:hypothetical protein
MIWCGLPRADAEVGEAAGDGAPRSGSGTEPDGGQRDQMGYTVHTEDERSPC